ncbi:MAG: carotenoid oxygenase family protein [Pseudomonadales bacterium]
MSLIDLNQGALAPVADEVLLEAPAVTGELPRDLNGVLIRNGPNPVGGRFLGSGVLSWWPEAAMLHGIAFADGRALEYRNRWVRTRRWAEANDPQAVASYPETNPNVNVISHAGEILALAEGSPPLAISRALDTCGAPRRHPGLVGGTNAHPKVDPVTGEMMTFRSGWQAPYLQYGVVGAGGSPICDQTVEIPAPSMMHDLAITRTHSILLDLNVGYDLSMLSRGYTLPLRWHDERPARLGVVPRHGGSVRWFEIEPCFIQHVVNAYDADESTIVLEALRYPWYLRAAADGAGFVPDPLALLWRYDLNLATGTATEQQLDDAQVELPRINETRTGSPYRYLYAVEQPSNAEMRGVIRYDRTRTTLQRFALPPGDQNSEPVFVPRPGARSEDDGYLIVCVYRAATDSSDVVVLNGSDIGQVLATVHLPRRIPAGFHGAWVNADGR